MDSRASAQAVVRRYLSSAASCSLAFAPFGDLLYESVTAPSYSQPRELARWCRKTPVLLKSRLALSGIIPYRSCSRFMAKLPTVPTGKELEDFVAALLQCTRHFVEKNIQERNVFELDVVATSYSKASPEDRVFEVKGGKDWGFPDVFKLLGQMTYLDVPRGALIAAQRPQDKALELYQDRCQRVNIDLLLIEDIDAAREIFKSKGYGTADEMLHELWRFSFWIERCLIQVLRQMAKTNQQAQAPREALRYYNLVNSGVFLTRDVVERVSQLYEAYKDHPYLTAGAAREMDGGVFDPVSPGGSPLIRKALFKGQHPLLQACMYLEHRARLSILKGAVDYLCKRAKQPQTSGRRVLADFGLTLLPTTFLRGLSAIEKEPNFCLYPLFWQVFLWGWGGFILKDQQEEEFQELSAQTGLPVDCIPAALQAFDKLFPISDGWLREISTASYRLVTMVPWPFCGIGAFQRFLRKKVENYSDLKLSGQYTASDLVHWHNAGVQIIEQYGAAAVT